MRGGGHNVAGRAVSDGGVMIDLAVMKGIHVDPQTRTARAQGGATWHEFNRETAAHGLATTGGAISTTGVAGLTLGGGLGWLMGVHGLSVDNLVSVEFVTAGGEVLPRDADEHPDLFWALRGGGGNFGVAVSFEFRLHPLARWSPAASSPTRSPQRATCCASSATFAGTVPGRADGVAGPGARARRLGHAARGARRLPCGPRREQAERDLGRSASSARRCMDAVGPMPYPAINTLLDAGFPQARSTTGSRASSRDLDDEAASTQLIEHFAAVPLADVRHAVEHFHGAVTRSACRHRVPHREPGSTSSCRRLD